MICQQMARVRLISQDVASRLREETNDVTSDVYFCNLAAADDGVGLAISQSYDAT